MHLAVITGYVMASLFALCGLFNTVQFCIYGSYANVGDFIRGLVIVLHPLAVATVILLLALLLCRQGQPRAIADVMHRNSIFIFKLLHFNFFIHVIFINSFIT